MRVIVEFEVVGQRPVPWKSEMKLARAGRGDRGAGVLNLGSSNGGSPVWETSPAVGMRSGCGTHQATGRWEIRHEATP